MYRRIFDFDYISFCFLILFEDILKNLFIDIMRRVYCFLYDFFINFFLFCKFIFEILGNLSWEFSFRFLSM